MSRVGSLAAGAAVGVLLVAGWWKWLGSSRPLPAPPCQSSHEATKTEDDGITGTADDVHVFDIERADAGHTLHTFTVQAHVIMIFSGQVRLARISTSPVHGLMTARRALTLMLKGTRLVAVWRHDAGVGGDYVEVGRGDGVPAEARQRGTSARTLTTKQE